MSVPARLLIAIFFSLVTCRPAAAQGVSMLNPMARTYNALGFVYTAPQGDGWRELGSAPDAFRIVYAEQLPDQKINTRADFAVQAFVIPEPDKVPDAFTLTRMSMSQRVQEKGDDLVALAEVQPVAGQLPVHEYTLVVKIGEQDFFEHHFVALAPDKTQYLAAKLVTQDKDFREAPYFAPLTQSVTSLAFPSAAATPKPADTDAPGAPPAPPSEAQGESTPPAPSNAAPGSPTATN